MVERRNLVGGGLAASLTALIAGGEAEAAQQTGHDPQLTEAVNNVRQSIDNLHTGAWARVNQIREQQRIWLRANHRYPDFIEIGVDIWDALYDWHVRYQQPISMTRSPDGRYLMAFMFTTFILRPDMAANYVGPPFDNSEQRRPQP
jgi:hypothetical protein